MCYVVMIPHGKVDVMFQAQTIFDEFDDLDPRNPFTAT